MHIQQEEIDSLFEGKEQWRVESFIRMMRKFDIQCSTNEQANFIRQGLDAAIEYLAKYHSDSSLLTVKQ